MQVTDEMVEAALRIRDTAMKQTLAARIPESGQFGAIAQDADWLVDALTAALAKAWRPIEEAKEDQWVWIIAFAPAAHGLPAIVRPCQWHPDAGFCVDELRTVTHWMPLPEPPVTKEDGHV